MKSELNKIASLNEKLTHIDNQIKTLNELAETIAKDGLYTKFNMEVKKPTIEPDKPEDIFDEHGFIKEKYLKPEQSEQKITFTDIWQRHTNGIMGTMDYNTIKEETINFEHSMNQTESLTLIGMLIADHLKRKEGIEKKIKSILLKLR